MAIPLAKKYSTPDLRNQQLLDHDMYQSVPYSGYSNNQYDSRFQQTSTSMMDNTVVDTESLVKADETWVNRQWRPAMGWLYMATCAFDFIIFPMLWSIFQALTHGQVTSQWQPLTLQGAGLYHLAMGAVLGIAAYGRTKEKISGTN